MYCQELQFGKLV